MHATATRQSLLEAHAARLRRVQKQLSQQLVVAEHTLAMSQRALADDLSRLYKRGDVSALAVMLGSESLDAAVSRIDDLSRSAAESKEIVTTTAEAQSRLSTLRASLHEERRLLAADVAAARATTAALAAARTQRVAFIVRLRRERKLADGQIAALEAVARRVERKSDAIQVAASSEPVQEAPAAAVPTTPFARTLTVSATGYSLAGRTATGMPVGFGVAAVDPALIPLGTRLTVPGYGEAVAADTGPAIRGNTIDLWFPSRAQAHAWGRRTITITLH